MILSHDGVPLLGVVAASGTGKTTLLRAVIPYLTQAGLRIGCVKHTHHPFEIDRPGKDSYLLRNAGASQMLLGSAGRWALMVETESDVDAPLLELVRRLDLALLDLVLVEGFRLEEIPKIEVHRGAIGQPLQPPSAPHVIAMASDEQPSSALTVPVLDINDPAAIAEFILAHVRTIGDLRSAHSTV